MKETKSVIRKKSPSLVTTDYDNFKTLRFFINQQHKAEQMMREIENFHASFVQSKLVNFRDYVKEHPDAAFNQFEKLIKKARYVYHIYPDGHKLELVDVICADRLRVFCNVREGKDYLYPMGLDYLKNGVYDPDISEEDQHLLDELYTAAFCEPQYEKADNCAYLKEKKIPIDRTFLIVKDFDKYVKNYAWHQKLIAETPEKHLNRVELYHIDVVDYYSYKNYNVDFDYDEIDKLLRKRFKKHLEVYKRLCLKHIDDSIERWYDMLAQPFHYGMYIKNSNIKTCVPYNDRVEFVSNAPYSYSIKISDDESTIDFNFSSTDLFRDTETTRYCTLTYKTDNNELVDFKTEVERRRRSVF